MNSVVILAGGKSTRMGRDKLELTLDGQTMLESVADKFSAEFENVYISVANTEKYPHIKQRKIADILMGAGPLSGLHAALSEVEDEGVFLVAADLPYADPLTAKSIIALCREKEICIIRLQDGRLEPLFGYYKKTLLHRCEGAILAGKYRMKDIVLASDTRFVAPAQLGKLWDERMIINVNYPEDYDKLKL